MLSVEEIVMRYLIPIAVVIIAALITRFVVNNVLLEELVKKRKIALTSRNLVVRIIDIVLTIIAGIIVTHILVPHLYIYVFVSVAIIIVLTLFYHVLREFLAYLQLIMRKIPVNEYVSIRIPGYIEPISGKLVVIDPISSEIHNPKYGKILILNSILARSIIRVERPRIFLRISMRKTEEINSMYAEVQHLVKRIETPVFKIDEEVVIEEVTKDRVKFRIGLRPITLEYRQKDLTTVLDELLSYESIRTRDPIIEISDSNL